MTQENLKAIDLESKDTSAERMVKQIKNSYQQLRASLKEAKYDIQNLQIKILIAC
jgi:hypothetical protein